MPPVWIPNFETTIERLNSNRKFDAERRVAEALNRIDSPNVTIFHSLRYAVQKNVGAATNLEIDFLVIWKNMGFVILEVKGGEIDYDAFNDKWWCIPREQPSKIYKRSPVEQVEGQKNDLCSNFLPKVVPKGFNTRSIVERLLVFPDVSKSKLKDQNGQVPTRINDFEVQSIVDIDQLTDLPTFIEEKLKPCEAYMSNWSLPGKLFDDTVKLLRSSVKAEIAPKHILENTDYALSVATERQQQRLKSIIGSRMLLMDGPAGTAKTVLGLSAVMSWEGSGENAYFITANKYLVDGLQSDPRYSHLKDRILTIHNFLRMALDVEFEDTCDSMVDVLTEYEFAYSGFSIVLDEAQDLDHDLYESLVSLLPCERLWVLRDNRQSLDKQTDKRKFEVGLMKYAGSYTLSENCRNSRQIAEYVAKEVNLPEEYVNDLLPYGDREPENIQVSTEEELNNKLIEITKRAIKDGFSTRDIVVISCDPNGRSSVYEKYCSPVGAKKYKDLFSYGGQDKEKIPLYHCLDFRGLESSYVLVTDIVGQEALFRASYLSGSRAKSRLAFLRVEDLAVRKAKESSIPNRMTF